MIARVYRFNPRSDAEPYYAEYSVDVKEADRMTVMDLLHYIHDNMDNSLSFFAHSACQHGICGRCGVKCNGKPGLACEVVLTGEDVVIEPLKETVIKDLVFQN